MQQTPPQIPSWPLSMPLPKLPKYVVRIEAKGRSYLYFRHQGSRTRLPDDAASPEFHEAYAAKLRLIKDQPRPSGHENGSVGWLITSFKRSPEFTTLRPKTQADYARNFDLLAPVATFPADGIRRKHINAIRDAFADLPRKRQLFGQVASLLFNFGIRELDLDMVNPARMMSREGTAKSYAPWSDEQMTAFEASNPPCHLMTAYMIARYTGPRRTDAVMLRRNDYVGQRLRIGGRKTDNPIEVACHPVLAAYLSTLPATLHLIADPQGRPVSPTKLTHDLRAHLDAIGLTGLHFHGLRHTAGKALAEAGCTPHEIAAVLGHATLQMVERYTKKAGQKQMADAAVLKMQGKK